MFQESELITLILGFITFMIILFVFLPKRLPGMALFYASFLLIFCSYIFTVIEGFAMKEFFNFLEHLCLALAGLVFAAGSWSMVRNSGKEQDRHL